MTIQDQILQKVSALPPERQREVLDFAEFLRQRTITQQSAKTGKSLEGALAHLKIDLSEEDIVEARREMWRNFPRELPE